MNRPHLEEESSRQISLATGKTILRPQASHQAGEREVCDCKVQTTGGWLGAQAA